MNFLKTLKESGAINQSLFPIIFGELLEDEDYWYEIENDIPRLSRDILLLYLGLTQAYCFALAHNKNTTIYDIHIPDSSLNAVQNIWNVDAPNAFSTFGTLFSYFKISSANGYSDFFNDNSQTLINDAFSAYAGLSAESGDVDSGRKSLRRDPNDFLNFLESLPLLRNTRFIKETMKFEFHLSNTTAEIKVSPFVTFMNFDNGPIGEPVDSLTTDCYILTSVCKGDKNNELYFDTLRLNETGGDMDHKKIRRQVQSNENLLLLCKTAKVETEWYSSEECWCDLKFLNKMVDASEKVLLEYCNIRRKEYQSERDIRDELLHILMDTDIHAVLSAKKAIPVKSLNPILFDLFLSEGLFKTVRSILINPRSNNNASSRRMFELYLNSLSSSGYISKQQIDHYISACDNRIAIALEKLSHIVNVDSAIYKKRELEIRAEWKTFYILQAAGIKTNNLFTDVETILSIDDFYDMIGNSHSSLELDLMNVLRILCVFYSALLENTVPFDEAKYYKDAERMVSDFDISNHTLESLFDRFIDIAKKAEASHTVEELLGRKGIGVNKIDYITYCRDRIMSPLDFERRLPKSSTGYGIFVSYAHEDKEIVKPIVDRWRAKGYSFFFDEKDIDYGQNWQTIAEAAMDHPDCKLVVAFVSKNSVLKTAVSQEIEHASIICKQKYPNDPNKQSRFVIPINLETEAIKNYLSVLAHTAPDVAPDFQRRAAKTTRQYILDQEVFLEYCTLRDNELDSEINRAYEELAMSEGSVVAPDKEWNGFALAIANFYSFLKFGTTSFVDADKINTYFNDDNKGFSECIFPIVASVKEARIKRDNIAIVGYELIRGKGRQKAQINNILTSRSLEVDDYYCIPKYRTSGDFGNWMVEPLLIRCDKFIEILNKTKENNNG